MKEMLVEGLPVWEMPSFLQPFSRDDGKKYSISHSEEWTRAEQLLCIPRHVVPSYGQKSTVTSSSPDHVTRLNCSYGTSVIEAILPTFYYFRLRLST